MVQAQQSKRIGETKMNKHSSRSHCIFTVTVQFVKKTKNDTVQYLGKLHMVDLAGSECAKNASLDSRQTQVSIDISIIINLSPLSFHSNKLFHIRVDQVGSARERERLNINRSLLTLGRVIAAVKDISDGKKNVRVPYRDSKLTRILQEALGGRCKTLIIATVSPSQTAISESLSTLNYAQSANGIINKPISSSFHEINATQGASAASAFLDPTGAVEQWFELECKLKYMEAQIEEAKIALLRKEQQQQRIVDRAEKAEQDLLNMESMYEDSQEKVVALEGQLDQEMMKCEQLTINLQNTTERAEKAEEDLAIMGDKYVASQERVAVLEDRLEVEIQKCQNLTVNLQNTEEALMRTSSILEATRKTERKLTAEANALIVAVKKSVSDGNNLYKLLEEARDTEIQRRKVTREFNSATATVLENISTKIIAISNIETDYHYKMTRDADKAHEDDMNSLSHSLEAMKAVSESVKTLTSAIKGLSRNEGGILPTLNDTTEELKRGLDEAKSLIKGGEDVLSISFETACEQLQQYSSNVKNMDEKFNEISESLRSEIRNSGDKSKNNIIHMVSDIIDSISSLSDANIATRKDLTTLLNDLQSISLHTMKEVGRQALKQCTRSEKSLAEFVSAMQDNDKLQKEVKEQLTFVNKQSNMQLKDISSQSDMLIRQKEAFATAKETHEKIQAEIMATVIKGVQELLSREINRLSQQNENQFKELTNENEKITSLNKSIETSTQDILNQVETNGTAVLNLATALHNKDTKFCDETSVTNNTFTAIKELAKTHHGYINDFSDKSAKKILELENRDEPISNALMKLGTDKDSAVDHLENSILDVVDDSVQTLNNVQSTQTKFVSKNMIPEIKQSFVDLKDDQNNIQSDLSNKLNNLKDLAEVGQGQMKSIVMNQCNKIDELNFTVHSQRTTFDESIIEPKRNEIETRHQALLGDMTQHYEKASGQLSQTKTLVHQADGTIHSFAKNEIHVDEEVPVLNPRAQIRFDEKLSTTPPDQEIIASLVDERKTFIKSPGSVLISDDNEMFVDTNLSSNKMIRNVNVRMNSSRSSSSSHRHMEGLREQRDDTPVE